MHRDGPRPNLFIIGSMKSGTTSLHHYLSTHPDVFMCEPKEPGFFTPEVGYYPTDEAWYRGLFAEAGDAKVVGESSTHYAKLPVYRGVPERIAAWSPEARFVFLMRDPVQRTVSHYWHRVKQMEEHRPMLRAVRDDVQYTAFSDYRRQLVPYFDLFGRDRVLLLTFEEMVREPRRVLERTLEWLGVDPALGTREFPKENARPEEVRRVRAGGLLRRLATSSAWESVSPLVPRALRERGRRMAALPVRPGAVSAEEAVRWLRPRMAEQARELEAFLGMEFPGWTTVFPERAAPRRPTAA